MPGSMAKQGKMFLNACKANKHAGLGNNVSATKLFA
jgi:hypothetical protein